MWKGVGRCGEVWRGVERCGEVWEGVDRCGEVWGGEECALQCHVPLSLPPPISPPPRPQLTQVLLSRCSNFAELEDELTQSKEQIKVRRGRKKWREGEIL